MREVKAFVESRTRVVVKKDTRPRTHTDKPTYLAHDERGEGAPASCAHAAAQRPGLRVAHRVQRRAWCRWMGC